MDEPHVGAQTEWPEYATELAVAAHCAAETKQEVRVLIKFIEELRYASIEGRYLTLAAQGYQRIAELEDTNRQSDSIFVAMWFDDSVNFLYDEAIKGAIEELGYKPYRVDQPSRVDKTTYETKVCDRIEVEIRRSRALIADFTHGKDGARGGVYYEAGLARGLGIPVIWTCREDMFQGKLHFDTRQYPHIGWKSGELEKFKQELSDRIRILTQTT